MSNVAVERTPAVTPAHGRGASSRLVRAQVRTAWLLLIPTLLIVAGVALIPLLQTVYLSFTNDRLADSRSAEFIGLDNYRFLLEDRVFRNAIWTTVKFSVITVALEFLLGLMIALVVNSQFTGRGLMRTAMLVPWAIPTVISARMWSWMYNDIYGVFNDILMKIGIINSPIAWLARDDTALGAIIAVDVWKTTPFVALLLLAGLQVIPSDIYEAATVDGANKIQQFFRITLPLLRPAILVTLIFRTLDALRVFDVFFVMFGDRRDTQTMAIYAQQNIVDFSDVGYGSAVCVGIFLIVSIFVVAYVTLLKVEQT